MAKKERLLISDKARAKRDAAILKLRGAGKTAREIADELKIKSFTVYNVLFAARKKGVPVAARRRERVAAKVARGSLALPRVHLGEADRLRIENDILRSILASVPQVKDLLRDLVG